MLILELLGTLSLRDETRPVPVSAQQKRLSGLLAILAVAGKQGLPRDRIETYLWPESRGDNARHSLDQAVYSIRNALGTDFIISTGRELRLNPELVQVDVWEFEDAIRAGQQARAAGIYKGPFLDGVHLADSRELESWIDTHRIRLRLEYQTAIEHLAKVSAGKGDHAQSVTWLRQLVNSDPLSSGATKKLLLALAAAGDRAGAVRQARLYQELVKQELEIEPDSEIESLAATLSRPASTEVAAPSARVKAAETADSSPTTPTVAAPSAEAGKGSSHRINRLVYALFALAILVSAAAVWGSIHTEGSRQVVRYTLSIDSTEAIVRAIPWAGRVAISPDGSRFAYIGGPEEQLLVRRRNELHATAIPGTEGAFTPFFAPDGRSVGFLREKSVWIAPLRAGPPIHVSDSLTGVAGGSWGPDGFIYTNGFESAPLVRVEARQGAVPRTFTALDTAKGEIGHLWPNVLPNGKGVVFTVLFSGKNVANGKASLAIAVAEIPSGKHRMIIIDGAYPIYVSPGILLYVTANRTLMTVPFDQNSLKVTGEPTALIEGMRLGAFGATDLAVSSTGTLVYSIGAALADQNKQQLVWLTRDGKPSPMDPDWQGLFQEPAISPDGKRLAITQSPDGRVGDIWIRQLDGGATVKLTNERFWNSGATWTPDGRSVTFSAAASKGTFDLLTQPADGSTKAVLVFHGGRVFVPRWSPDGKWLTFGLETTDPEGGDIVGIRPGIDTTPVPLVATRGYDGMQEVSPDSHWMAYASDVTGRFEVYVVPFPNTKAAKWTISSAGATWPTWSSHGNELIYRDTKGDIFSVAVRTAPTFSFGKPRRLFVAKRSEFLSNGYTVSPDGQRVLMIRRVGAAVPDKFIVVENWFEELNAKSRK